MSTTLKDNAICLRLFDWSESSQIAIFLTADHGKIATSAKGAKRQTPSTLARYSGGIDLLASGELVTIVKPNSELGLLTEWNLHNAYFHIRDQWDAFSWAMYAADLIYHIVQDHDPHPKTYHALSDFLTALNQSHHPPRPVDLLLFHWRLITDMGSQPILDAHAQDRQPIDLTSSSLAFSPSLGGLVYADDPGEHWRLRPTTIQAMQQIASHHDTLTDEQLTTIDAVACQRSNRLLCTYLKTLIDRDLPTMPAILNHPLPPPNNPQ